MWWKIIRNEGDPNPNRTTLCAFFLSSHWFLCTARLLSALVLKGHEVSHKTTKPHHSMVQIPLLLSIMIVTSLKSLSKARNATLRWNGILFLKWDECLWLCLSHFKGSKMWDKWRTIRQQCGVPLSQRDNWLYCNCSGALNYVVFA